MKKDRVETGIFVVAKVEELSVFCYIHDKIDKPFGNTVEWTGFLPIERLDGLRSMEGKEAEVTIKYDDQGKELDVSIVSVT